MYNVHVVAIFFNLFHVIPVILDQKNCVLENLVLSTPEIRTPHYLGHFKSVLIIIDLVSSFIHSFLGV